MKSLLVVLLLVVTHFSMWLIGNSEALRLAEVGYIKGEAATIMKMWDACENTHRISFNGWTYHCAPSQITDTTPQTEPQS